jgi:SPP1 gp7 family putative phage head morphogenesis protein
MADKAHNETDGIIADMEAHLAEIYEQAGEEIEAKADEYFSQFERLDAQKKKQVEEGRISEDEYIRWRKNKILYGKHWTQLKEKIAAEYANVNRIALSYINGRLPKIYALNYNAIGKDIGSAVKGYSFELVNADVVKNLATKDDTLLPYKYLDGKKDVRWNTKKVNSAVLQGILQGESIPKMAKRLQSVTEMNKTSAIRNARTCVTGAECKARQDGFERAAADGIELQREWIAAIDGRTRHAHRLLDGQLVGVDEPFKSEFGDIMFPGDPEASPENVYNCRCTVAAKVISINGVKISDRLEKADRATAQDWWEKERAKDPKEFDIRQKMLYNEKADKEQLAKYKKRLHGDAPGSLAKFQNIKYREPEKYAELKKYYRYRGIAPDSDIRFFYADKAKNKLVDQGKIRAKGIVVKHSPIALTSTNDHAKQQMNVRGITVEQAQMIIDKSKFALRQQEGKVFSFYSEFGFAAIDTKGMLRTVGELDSGGDLLFKEVLKHIEVNK